MKKIVIFDFDGVMVESFPVCFAVTQLYDPELTAEEYKSMFTGNIYDAVEARGKQAKRDPAFDFFKEYMKRIVTIKPMAGIKDLLEETQKRGLKMFIVSSTNSQPIHDYLTMHDLASYFTKIYGGDVEKSKIKKLEMILKDSQTKPEEAVFITDTLGDLIEADKVDIDSIAVSYGFHDRALLLKAPRPVPIADTISQLADLLYRSQE